MARLRGMKATEKSVGLLTKTGEVVPLQGVKINGRLQGSATELTVLQRYRNDESKPIEAVYLFPLPSEAAVTGLEVRVGDRTLKAEIDEREAAFERYDDALREGHGAVLLDQERPNVFQVSVGSILPGQTVLVEIRLALLADSWDRGVRLMIPSTISPRYTPASLPPDVLREIERTTPPYALEVPFGMSIELSVEMASAIRAIESPSHPVRTEIDGARARVVFSRGEEAMDRDFVLTVETAEPNRAAAFVARRDGRDHLLVELRPDLPIPLKIPRDLLFLVDCSGSMNGDSIDQARRAVELCLRALNAGDRFQVVRFGNSHRSLFPDFQTYSQETLDQAVQLVRAMEADLGGTEILAALTSSVKPAKGGSLDVIVLTDGEVSNETQVLAFAKKHRGAVRFFSFGIGAGSSESLVRGLARESGGEAEFIHPGERIEEKVLRQFGRISSPALSEISLDWGGLKVEQAPTALPPVFSGGAFRVMARLGKGVSAPEGTAVHLLGTTATGPVKWTATLALASEANAIPLLWARERIRDLEAGFGVAAGSRQKRGAEPGKRAMVTISKEYGVLCSETSFVAVVERPDAERTSGEVELRRVPVMVTAGWHGIGRAKALPRSMVSMACIPSFNSLSSQAMKSCDSAPLESDSPDLEIPSFPRRQAAPAYKAPPPPWHIALLMEQKADGSFELTSELVKAAKLSDREVKKLLGESHLDHIVFATALAVITLQRRARAESDTWGAAVTKALEWLERSGQKVTFHPCQWLEMKFKD